MATAAPCPIRTGPRAMRTDHDLLRLIQWLSPAFPVGGFAYSHGLDWMIGEEGLRDRMAVQSWLMDVVRHGSGWNDAVILSLTHRGEDADRMAALAMALAGSAERRTETSAQGGAFMAAAAALDGSEPRDWPMPVAVGWHARKLDLSTATVVAQYLHAFVTNLATIATRAVPLGQNEGQRLIAEVAEALPALAARACEAGEDELGGAVPMGDIAAMLHETQEPRLFLT